MNNVYTFLDQHGITYTIHEHPAVFTHEEAKVVCKDLVGGKVKNLFMRNDKGDRHYLVITYGDKKIDIKKIARTVQEKRLGFASTERLKKYLGVQPGSVSLFGLINDTAHEVTVLLDQEMLNEKTLLFHPNANTASLAIRTEDVHKILAHLGNRVIIEKL